MVQPINSWSEFKKVLRQLKDEDVKKQFETIIIDTADIAYDYCEKYICSNVKRPDGGVGVDSVADIPYGKGYSLIGKEFDDCLRSIVQMDYGLVVISHATDKAFTDEQGHDYNQIVPTLDRRARNIVSRMCDIIGYSRVITNKDGVSEPKLFIRGTQRYIAGSRFKYTPDYIDFNYQSLVKAIGDAIDRQMQEDGEEYFTDTRQNAYIDTSKDLDFDELMNEFNEIIKNIVDKSTDEEMQEYWQPRITQITDKYLGKGNKVGNCSREQVEALSLIIDDLKEIPSIK